MKAKTGERETAGEYFRRFPQGGGRGGGEVPARAMALRLLLQRCSSRRLMADDRRGVCRRLTQSEKPGGLCTCQPVDTLMKYSSGGRPSPPPGATRRRTARWTFAIVRKSSLVSDELVPTSRRPLLVAVVGRLNYLAARWRGDCL